MLSIFLKNYKVRSYKINNSDKINNNMLNTFPIYVINLIEDKLRRNYIIKLFKAHKINYTLIIVKKFKYLTTEDLIKAKIHCSKLGCILSHLWCINNSILQNHERFIVFEDDIIFHKNFNQLFKMVKKQMEINNIDLLMLGSLDFNLKTNLENTDELIYYPTKSIVGAHANIYSLEFAKVFLNYKLTASKILEFDYDYHNFINNYKIGICMPNLVICELSTTNINHHFSPLDVSGFEKYKRFFPNHFTYNDYEYILLNFITFVKEQLDEEKDKFNSFEEMVLSFSKKIKNRNMINISQWLTNGGYKGEDILEIISNVKNDKY